jgi:phenylalanyl-tRNA synthetase alpha chain
LKPRASAISARAGASPFGASACAAFPREEKPIVGKLLNEARNAVTAAIEQRAAEFRANAETAALSNIDITLPGQPAEIGGLHPLTQMLDRAISIFRRMGFALAEGPDVDTEWYCFDALNTAPDHPARNEQDTFYLPDGRLLRTHTSRCRSAR